MSIHSSTGLTPFEVTYGKPPPSIPKYIQGTSSIDATGTLIAMRATIHATLKC